jgi:hypothetical protein
MILNTIGVSQLISFYQYVKNETNISQCAINNGRWSILLWYVVQHVIDRCRPHSLDTTSAAGVANLSGRPLSGPRTDGDQRVPPRTSRDATRRDAVLGAVIFFFLKTIDGGPHGRVPSTEAAKQIRYAPAHCSPPTPATPLRFPGTKRRRKPLFYSEHHTAPSDPRPFLSPCLLSLSRAGENGE